MLLHPPACLYRIEQKPSRSNHVAAGDPMPTLVIANKIYSSWSLRALDSDAPITGCPSRWWVIPLDQPEPGRAYLAYSPAGQDALC